MLYFFVLSRNTRKTTPTSHGRRSSSNLRRPPQEVAASCTYGGARKHKRSGATVGEPRPSATNPAPFPSGEGVTAKAVTDGESLACSASRRTRMRAVTPQPGSPSASRAFRPCSNPPEWESRGPKALWRGSGARSPSVPPFSRAFSMTEGNQLNREPGVGTAHRGAPASPDSCPSNQPPHTARAGHQRVKSRFFKGTKARSSVK